MRQVIVAVNIGLIYTELVGRQQEIAFEEIDKRRYLERGYQMHLITTNDLEHWAGSRSAQGRLPYYVKKLICAVVQPEKLRFPSDDAVWLPGYDGELMVNGTKHRFVPDGYSVWEIGTNSRPITKATSDYKKRNTTQKNKSEISYVFVTPISWEDVPKRGKSRKTTKAAKSIISKPSNTKTDWIAKRMNDGWKNILVLDNVDLQSWLEDAPAVAQELAAEMSLAPADGYQILDDAWEDWSRRTKVQVSEELVVVGREKQEEDFVRYLTIPSDTFIVRADSPRETFGFSLACLRRLNFKERNLSLDARVIVADNDDVAKGFRHFENLIILLKEAREQVSSVLSSHGRHVIIPEGNDIHSERNVIELSRPSHGQFVDALLRMGMTSDEADRAAHECGLSVTIFQRTHAQANFKRPAWSDGENVKDLMPALLAGKWNRKSESDKKILCQLAGVDETGYAIVEDALQQFSLMDEPPLRRFDEMWTLTASADAFQLMAKHITASQLDQFKSIFQKVFGRIDPKVEIPIDEWFSYDMKGEKGPSSWLRNGLAETLLLIAERGKSARLKCIDSPQTYADQVVKGIPNLKDDWRVLASIRDQYPRLMEAAPRPFLECLENLLKVKPNDMRRLFVEGSGIFGGGNLHTGLLWGLETIAWSPDYLPQVTLILSRLASLDPGLRIYNRPINSLRDIFLSWNPGTNATPEERLNAIDLVLARELEIGWNLLTKLLPEIHSVSMMTAKPRWRDFGDVSKGAKGGQDRIQFMLGIADRAFAQVGIMPDRWGILLNSLRGLPSSYSEKALEQLRAIGEGSSPANMKAALWKVILGFVHEHRTYESVNWALPKELIDKFEIILPFFAPNDLIDKNIWLFDEWLPGLSDFQEDIDIRQEAVTDLRRKVVAEILEQRGIRGLVELGTRCNYPGFVALTALPLISDIDIIYIFIEQAISAGEKGVFLSSHISAQTQQRFGDKALEIIRETIKRKGALIGASLLKFWPDGMVTWKHAEELDISTEYWQQKIVLPVKMSPEEKVYEIDHLIQAKRSTIAFRNITYWMDDISTDALVRLFDATMKELVEAKTTEDIQQIGFSTYEMQQFLIHLRNRSDLSKMELARREYQALPLLRFSDVQGLTLHEFMAEDTDFFVKIICDAFLPAHRDKDKDIKPTNDVEVRAQVAYTLLNGMNIIPGQHSSGFDEQKLQQWVDIVRKKAIELDREVIADQQIGEILAHSRVDPTDNAWPHQIIRSLIERESNDQIDLGFRIGRFNMRGVVSRSPYEGGAQERELAKQYNLWAVVSRVRWPRMADVLEKMAQEWEEHARREDIRVEQEKAE